jgi:hypothetical protein
MAAIRDQPRQCHESLAIDLEHRISLNLTADIDDLAVADMNIHDRAVAGTTVRRQRPHASNDHLDPTGMAYRRPRIRFASLIGGPSLQRTRDIGRVFREALGEKTRSRQRR